MASWLENVLKRNKELESMFDFDEIDFIFDTTHRAYLKKIALDTNINFIARTISLSDFRHMKNGKRQYGDWHYLLNVRPNRNQSATEFWEKFIYKLIYDNEVLVILSDSNDLLIADDFEHEEYAVYEDTFSNVKVKDYTFKRTFKMNEVLYLTYSNDKLTKFTEGMFKDYADLFTRMIETMMFDNQIRATVSIDSTQSLDKKNTERLQKFINKLFNAFKKNALAIVPKLKGFEYKEESNNRGYQSRSVDELTKLKKSLVDEVANIIGIPASLIHGDMSEYDTAIKAYVKFCNNQFVKKIQDELNAKLFTKNDYLNGEKIEVKGINDKDPLELAQAIDKLISSGAFNRNEVREMAGAERSDNPKLDEFVITKNYRSIEGGEEE